MVHIEAFVDRLEATSKAVPTLKHLYVRIAVLSEAHGLARVQDLRTAIDAAEDAHLHYCHICISMKRAYASKSELLPGVRELSQEPEDGGLLRTQERKRRVTLAFLEGSMWG